MTQINETPLTRDEYIAKATELFGPDPKKWRFVCPVCSTEQGYEEFVKHTNIPMDELQDFLGFSCIGRWAKGGCEHAGFNADHKKNKNEHAIGCDYAGGGFFKLYPVLVLYEGKTHGRFAFAEETS